jgi:hypothetical protein
MVFTWFKCLTCNKQYVAFPDPASPQWWLFFDPKSNDLEHPTHLCCGGFLCIEGHPLEVVAPAAVMNHKGQWLLLRYAEVPSQVN